MHAKGGSATICFLEGSLGEVLLRRVLRSPLVRVAEGQRFLEGFLEGRGVIELRRCLEGRNTPFRQQEASIT